MESEETSSAGMLIKMYSLEIASANLEHMLVTPKIFCVNANQRIFIIKFVLCYNAWIFDHDIVMYYL